MWGTSRSNPRSPIVSYLHSVNDLPNCLSSSQPRMYADDTHITYEGADLISIQSNLNHDPSILKLQLTTFPFFVLKLPIFSLNDFADESVLRSLRASPFMSPFLIPGGLQEEKCVPGKFLMKSFTSVFSAFHSDTSVHQIVSHRQTAVLNN